MKDRRNAWSPWAVSLVAHVAVVGALLLIVPVSRPTQSEDRPQTVTALVYVPQPKAETPLRVPRSLVHVAPRPQPPAVIQQPQKPSPFRPLPPTPARHKPTVAIPAPEPVAVASSAPAPVRSNAPELPAPAPVVKTGVFGTPGTSPKGAVPAPRLEVQTGGFGSVDSGTRNQAGGTGAAVHVGGFGDAGSGAGSVVGKRAAVADAGFGRTLDSQPGPQHLEKQAAETAVEILWKPKPAYTEEARARKLEGNVTLEVIFRANGEVHVSRVVHGLGSGLDESARAAAEQIRFRPGKRDGVPVDRTGLVQITFELT